VGAHPSEARARKGGVGSILNPSDQGARDRFATELERNFSVVASAGSGKTAAITKRILSIASSANADELLPRMVIVTFANRAADEMQQRTRQLLLEKNLGAETEIAFNRAFFGTIHSFCMKLLTDYGHFLGLPAPLELLTDDDDLWQEFVQGQTRIGHSLGEKERAQLLRLVQARDLMDLARRAEAPILCRTETKPSPLFDFGDIYAQSDQSRRDTISKSQAELREWEKRFAGDWEFLRWPVCFSTDTSKFTQIWREKFSPFRRWICSLATRVAAEVQRDYREFRLERGLVTYPDQVALAKELLQHPVAATRIREQNFRLILDEAQDTEPAQFSVLLEVARPPGATGDWMETHSDPPQRGHFCMVGDFQQSIYRDRADLPYYRAVHQALTTESHGESLEFSVTFRLDQKQLDFVNETFREILNDPNDHVRFVELHPRPNILPGRVIRVPLGKELLPEGEKKLKDYQKARIEAQYLARWIKEAGLPKLCADSWREVAVLCPRKAWLQTMAAALRKVGLPVSVQSENDVKGDSPAYAWLTALLTIMTQPRNAYEIVGVLRDIFGTSDHDLAAFSEGQGYRFRIDEEMAAAGKVSTHLRALAAIRQGIEGLALFDAVTRVVNETHLRERLFLLPVDEFGDVGRELDALLAQAAEAEASGLILSEFAGRLRSDFTTARGVRFAADDNAIQLITFHKSKGSEWQCVIVPFLAREQRPPSLPYPHFVKVPSSRDLLLTLGKEDKSKELKEAIEDAQARELERLLYVATTRARRTLVLALDQEIFSNTNGQLVKTAQLRRLLRDKDSYSGEFDDCTSLLDNVEESPPGQSAGRKIQRKIEPLGSGDLRRASDRASDFVVRITPSAFGLEVAEAERMRSRLDNPATLYGRWWHRLFQRLPWNEEPSWEKLLTTALRGTPDRKRSESEWKLFRVYMEGRENFRERFGSGMETRAEVPFLLTIRQSVALEGVIDLMLIDARQRRALILDWKTNETRPGEIGALRERYRPQITAYWKAMSEITGFSIEAGLYSTAAGTACYYETAELEREWLRLQQLPADRAGDEIEPDE
jgi:ATP-dependent helicase/nuclease subunit A